MSDQDIIDTAIVVLKDFGLYDGCTICGHIGYDEDDLSDIGEALLAASCQSWDSRYHESVLQ